jgi:hypothetical protein
MGEVYQKETPETQGQSGVYPRRAATQLREVHALPSKRGGTGKEKRRA